VLNLEFDGSRHKDCKPIDASLGELLARQAGLMAYFVTAGEAVREAFAPGFENHIVRSPDHGRPGLSSPEPHSMQILRGIRESLGVFHGLLYLADYRNSQLVLCAKMPDPFATYSMPFIEEALSTKVFLENHYYWAKVAEKDLYVSQDGRTLFQIQGSLLGVPLRLGSIVIGCIVLWGPKRDGIPVSDQDVEALKEYSELTVFPVAQRFGKASTATEF
jgi:hypothetical protein